MKVQGPGQFGLFVWQNQLSILFQRIQIRQKLQRDSIICLSIIEFPCPRFVIDDAQILISRTDRFIDSVNLAANVDLIAFRRLDQKPFESFFDADVAKQSLGSERPDVTIVSLIAHGPKRL